MSVFSIFHFFESLFFPERVPEAGGLRPTPKKTKLGWAGSVGCCVGLGVVCWVGWLGLVLGGLVEGWVVGYFLVFLFANRKFFRLSFQEN